MSDSLIISTAVSIVKNPTYQPQLGETQVVVTQGEKPIVASSKSNGEQKLPFDKKQEAKEQKKLEIEILPLDEPMMDKISQAIDKAIYGKETPPHEDKDKVYVKGYEPFVETGNTVDIKG